MWVVFMVKMFIDIIYFIVMTLGCVVLMALIVLALSVFVPTMIRTIKEELKRGNKDENG